MFLVLASLSRCICWTAWLGLVVVDVAAVAAALCLLNWSDSTLSLSSNCLMKRSSSSVVGWMVLLAGGVD